MTPDTLATGKRVVIRRLRPDDLDIFWSYRNDPDVARYQSWPQMSQERTAGFLHHCATAHLFQKGEWCQVGIADQSSDTLLGDLGIHLSDDEKDAELGVTLALQHQGQGFATEAFLLATTLILDQTPAHRIWAITDHRNHASIALIERCGFTHDRTESTTEYGKTVTEHFFVMPRSHKQ